jgi:hypothetical protein
VIVGVDQGSVFQDIARGAAAVVSKKTINRFSKEQCPVRAKNRIHRFHFRTRVFRFREDGFAVGGKAKPHAPKKPSASLLGEWIREPVEQDRMRSGEERKRARRNPDHRIHELPVPIDDDTHMIGGVQDAEPERERGRTRMIEVHPAVFDPRETTRLTRCPGREEARGRKVDSTEDVERGF